MATRREALAALLSGGAMFGATSALAHAGLTRIRPALADLLAEPAPLPLSLDAPTLRRRVSRLGFGPRPGELSRLRGEHESEAEAARGWLRAQLSPGTLPDRRAELRTAFMDVEQMPSDLVFELRPEHLEAQLESRALIRATHSKRHLHELMVSFWNDHFHVAIGKDRVRHLAVVHDRRLRRHALGSFPLLLRAALTSPAMLVYLDAPQNQIRRHGDVVNENLARELLELHTLGVDGGYSQRDVMEAARCLSGWTVREHWAPAEVVFDPETHDQGPKTVLGHRIPGGSGAEDLDHLLAILVRHPSCAQHVSRRMATFLAADEPAEALVSAGAEAFRASGGDIRAMVRALAEAPEFATAPKLKRPLRFLASALRVAGAAVERPDALRAWLGELGQSLYQHPTPDGYPHDQGPWLGTLADRWRFALELTRGRVEGVELDLSRLLRGIPPHDEPSDLHALFVWVSGAPLRPAAARAIDTLRALSATPLPEVTALALASPEFQHV